MNGNITMILADAAGSGPPDDKGKWFWLFAAFLALTLASLGGRG